MGRAHLRAPGHTRELCKGPRASPAVTELFRTARASQCFSAATLAGRWEDRKEVPTAAAPPPPPCWSSPPRSPAGPRGALLWASPLSGTTGLGRQAPTLLHAPDGRPGSGVCCCQPPPPANGEP